MRAGDAGAAHSHPGAVSASSYRTLHAAWHAANYDAENTKHGRIVVCVSMYYGVSAVAAGVAAVNDD